MESKCCTNIRFFLQKLIYAFCHKFRIFAFIMNNHQTDILKQPIPVLLGTFALLLTVQTRRWQHTPYPTENLGGLLSPLGGWIDTTLNGGMGVAIVTLSVVITSLIITRIISRYTLSAVRSLVPMVLFVIGVCGVTFPVGSVATMLSLLMVAHSADLMIMSFKRTERFGEVMKASFWAGLATLIVPDLIYVLALLPLQWIIWQRSMREMVAGVIMVLLPIIPTSFAWWVGGKKPLWFIEEWCRSITPLHSVNLESLYIEIGGLVPTVLLGALLLLTLASIVVAIGSVDAMRLRARKGHTYFITLYLVGLFLLLIGSTPAIAIPLMGYASVPIIHTLFVRRKGTLSTTIYILVLLLALAAAILPTL